MEKKVFHICMPMDTGSLLLVVQISRAQKVTRFSQTGGFNPAPGGCPGISNK